MDNHLIEAIKRAKEQRFTLSSRILTAQKISVRMIEDKTFDPACINMATLELLLNEAHPRENNPVRALVYDRAKLYHELGHALFTAKPAKSNRDELYKKSSNGDLFLNVSNVLEDGRIERLMSERFKGVQPFFDALLSQMMKGHKPTPANKIPLGSLILYVRKFAHTDEHAAQFWSPFTAQINEAVKRSPDSNAVFQIAFDIVEALSQSQSEQEKEKQPKQPTENGGDNGQESENDTPPETEEETNGEQLNGNGASQNPPLLTEKQIEQIVESGFLVCSGDATEEWNGILEQALGDGQQQYGDESEENNAAQLTALFQSVLTDSQRKRSTQSRCGVLNTLSLPKALTSRRCFQQDDERPSKPHVALLLDQSGSMRARKARLTQAARVLNGALRGSGIDTLTIGFGVGIDGHAITEYKTIPQHDELPCNGRTPTAAAMQAAKAWLEAKQAARGLVIVVTDGIPDGLSATKQALDDCNALGATVLGVRIGDSKVMAAWEHRAPVENQFNAHIELPDVADLPNALEPILLDYIAGTL